MECARRDLVPQIRTCDLEVYNEEQRGENAQYVGHQSHLGQELRQVC